MTNQQAPEALRLAAIANSDGHITNIERNQIARELRRLHYENERLAAQADPQQPAPSAAEGATYHLGACIVEDMLHATVMRKEPGRAGAVTVLLSEQIPVERLQDRDVIVDAAPQPSPTPQADSAPAEAVQRIIHLRADRERRVYVAGPMTGLPEYNFPLFNATAARLRSEGWHVENPAEHGHVEGAVWADYLRWDISRIATCGAIYLLPGWSKSKGATLEVRIAGELGMQVLLADGAEAPQADSQPAADEATAMNRTRDLAEAGRWPSDWVEAYRRGYSDRAASAPADSVTAPAGGNWVDANDVNRLVRELDVALNGEAGAAAQASLCDVMAQVRHEVAKRGQPLFPTPPAQSSDGVREDAARWQELRAQHEDDAAERCCVFAPNDMRECLVPVGSLPGELDAFIDAKIAARKQGGAT